MNKTNIIIFGTSNGAKQLLDRIDHTKVEIVCYIDNDESKLGSKFKGKEIISPNKVNEIDYDYIVLASASYYKEMTEQLIENGVERDKIISGFKKKEKTSKQLLKEIYENNVKYSKIIKDEHLPNYFINYAVCKMLPFNEMERNLKLYNYPDYLLKGIDFVRLSNVELIAKEIKERNILGEVAELGVYRGDFSKFISDLFPDKKLYLFDTFEGFSKEDVSVENMEGFSNAKVGHLADTNEQIVLNKIGRKDNIEIRKGYFPESTIGMKDETFAFVSIDVDLYNPTYEGLKYFYERLSKGGYILIHDYNFHYYRGVKKAVRDFCDEKGINLVPISDYFGSAVIVK